MLKKLSYILIGIIIGSLSFGTSFGFANQQIRLIVNGQVINSDVPAQIINGRTMVPARALAEALGADVLWDQSSNSVIITSINSNSQIYSSLGNSPTKSNSIDLTSLDYFSSNCGNIQIDKNTVFGDWPLRLGGKEYSKGFLLADGLNQDMYIAYKLNSCYKRLTGYFGIDDSCSVNTNVKLTIYGDNHVLFESPYVKKGDIPVEVDVDITGVDLIKFNFSSSNSNAICVWFPELANPKLHY